MKLSNEQTAFLIKLYNDLNNLSKDNAMSVQNKIDLLINLISDPRFVELSQTPDINDVNFDFGNGVAVSFADLCDTAAQLCFRFLPNVNYEQSRVFASVATYTAVLAGYKNPMIPEMGNGPKAVILTLCHNSEKILDRAVKSVLTQTYWNFDYFLADNASTDNTREKILEIEKSDPRVHHIFYDENKFPDVYATLIPSLITPPPEYEYFAICDHDDELYPRFLEISVNEALTENADLVFGGEQYYYPPNRYSQVLKSEIKLVMDTPESYSDYLNYFILYSAWFGILFSTELLKKTDLSSNTNLVRAHDILVVLDAIEKSKKCILLTDLFYRHYVNESSGSTLPDKRNINSSVYQFNKSIEVYKKRALLDKEKITDFHNYICENILRDLLGAVNEVSKCEITADSVYLYLGYLDLPLFYNELIPYLPYNNKTAFIQVASEMLRIKEKILKHADENQKIRLNHLFGVLESELKKLTA